jgi:hypothetical protein
MSEVNYGVVRISGRWTIIGRGLRYGAYDTREEAEEAMRRLAAQTGGLPVKLHFEDELGQLRRSEGSSEDES